jgi:hypothetical protein
MTGKELKIKFPRLAKIYDIKDDYIYFSTGTKLRFIKKN